MLLYKTLFKEKKEITQQFLWMWAVRQLTERLNAAVDQIIQAGSFGQMSQGHHHSELGDLGQARLGRERAVD